MFRLTGNEKELVFNSKDVEIYRSNGIATVEYWDEANQLQSIAVNRDSGWNIECDQSDDKVSWKVFHSMLAFGFSLKVFVREGKGMEMQIPRDEIQENGSFMLKSIRPIPGFVSGMEGDGSQLVLPVGTGGLCHSKGKSQAEYKLPVFYPYSPVLCNMPLFGVVKANNSMAVIVEGGKFDFYLSIRTNWGSSQRYSVDMVFELRDFVDDEPLAEDISTLYVCQENLEASFADIGMAYRRYNMEQNKLPTLASKIENNPVVEYSSRAMCIRFRMGHKQVPPVILEQTPENEPPVSQIYMTFNDVDKLINECANQKVGPVEFCLVGWNYGGHDGSWPQVFPVAEEFGGEQGYRELIRHAKELGYPVSGHDNYWSTCSLAENFDPEDIMLTHEGKHHLSGKAGGGQYYQLCAKSAYEKYVRPRLEQIAELGVSGTYYSDVISVGQVTKCYHEQHPESRRDNAYWTKKILETQQEFFGGASSEGGRDWAVPELDRAFSIAGKIDYSVPYIDETIPLYPMVYHGFLIYNAFREGINMLPGNDVYLTSVAYGSTPMIYYHHIFNPEYSGTNGWEEHGDFRFGGDEKLPKDVAIIKRISDDTARISALQTEFINEFRQLESNVTETVYSNGAKVIVNHSDKEYKTASGNVVPAKDFIVISDK